MSIKLNMNFKSGQGWTVLVQHGRFGHLRFVFDSRSLEKGFFVDDHFIIKFLECYSRLAQILKFKWPQTTLVSICNLKRSITSRFHKVLIITSFLAQVFKTSSSIESISCLNQLSLWFLQENDDKVFDMIWPLDNLSLLTPLFWLSTDALSSKRVRGILVIKSIPENVISNVTFEVGAEIEMLKKWKRVKNGIRGRLRLLETEYILIKSGFQWRL